MGSHEGSQQYQEMQNSHLISLIVSCFPGNFGLSLVVLKLAEWKLTDIEWLHLTHWFKEMAQYISPTTLQPPPSTQHMILSITVRLCRNKLLTSYLYSACPYQNIITLQMLNPSSYTTPLGAVQLSAGSDITTSRLQIINPHNDSSSRTKNVKAVCPVNHNELRGGTGVQGSMGRGQGLVFQTNAITFL